LQLRLVRVEKPGCIETFKSARRSEQRTRRGDHGRAGRITKDSRNRRPACFDVRSSVFHRHRQGHRLRTRRCQHDCTRRRGGRARSARCGPLGFQRVAIRRRSCSKRRRWHGRRFVRRLLGGHRSTTLSAGIGNWQTFSEMAFQVKIDQWAIL